MFMFHYLEKALLACTTVVSPLAPEEVSSMDLRVFTTLRRIRKLIYEEEKKKFVQKYNKSIVSNIRHEEFFRSFIRTSPSRSYYPPWILKRAVLESSGGAASY